MEQRNRTGAELHYFSDPLKRKLNQMRYASATVVEAPSGYGKTTAVRDFLETQIPQGTPVYWFTAADETPAAGFSRLCREIYKIDRYAGERLLRIEVPNAVTIGETTDALRSIRCKNETYLVIDDFHYLQEFLPPAFFLALIDHGGEGLHIIIMTQILRRNVLAVIAGRGFLRITAADLRLNAEDIRCYYALAGVSITPEDAHSIEGYTEGWVIAVCLQLRSFLETGVLSHASSVLALMEHLTWGHLTEAQQEFLLCLPPFEMITVQQACALTGYDTLPEYALEALRNPFIRYDPQEGRYELHSILAEMLSQKRRERGEDFKRKYLLRAGDLCRDGGRTVEALSFYAQVRDYERMLSLDLSQLILETIGDIPFSELAGDIALNCPADIKKRHLLAMLQVAWALFMAGMNQQFNKLMEELLPILKAESNKEGYHLLGEWMLLSSFTAFPSLKEMTRLLRLADGFFQGKCSQVILPAAPWWFGNHSPLAEFHTQPGEADREAEDFEEYIALYSKLTNGHGSGADVLFRAELAYHRGNLYDAEILTYKAMVLAESKQQSVVQLGATMLQAQIALHKADTSEWQQAISSMERAVSFPSQNNYIIRTVLDIIRGTLLNELHDHKSIAGWLQKGDFSGRRLLPSVVSNAQFVYLSLMMHQGEFARLIGTAQAMVPDSVRIYPFRELLLYLTLAVGHISLGDRTKARFLIEYAAQRALPDRLIFPIVSYSWLLQGLTDELIEREYPALLDKFNEIRERFLAGWTRLHNDILPEELPPDLTPREYEVAKLAAEGMRNSEIAQKLVVTESTVRAHLRAIFQKLDIDRRARLAEKLK